MSTWQLRDQTKRLAQREPHEPLEFGMQRIPSNFRNVFLSSRCQTHDTSRALTLGGHGLWQHGSMGALLATDVNLADLFSKLLAFEKCMLVFDMSCEQTVQMLSDLHVHVRNRSHIARVTRCPRRYGLCTERPARFAAAPVQSLVVTRHPFMDSTCLQYLVHD